MKWMGLLLCWGWLALAQVHVNGIDVLRDLEQEAGMNSGRMQRANILIDEIEKELEQRYRKKLVTFDAMIQTRINARLTHARIALRSDLNAAEVRGILENLQDLVLDTYFELDVLQLFASYHGRGGDMGAQLAILEEITLHPEFGQYPDCQRRGDQFEALAAQASLLENEQMETATSIWEAYFQAYFDSECLQSLAATRAKWLHFQKVLKGADQPVPEHLAEFFQQGARENPKDKTFTSQEVKQYQAAMTAILKENAGY
jgi:hypothetical protein